MLRWAWLDVYQPCNLRSHILKPRLFTPRLALLLNSAFAFYLSRCGQGGSALPSPGHRSKPGPRRECRRGTRAGQRTGTDMGTQLGVWTGACLKEALLCPLQITLWLCYCCFYIYRHDSVAVRPERSLVRLRRTGVGRFFRARCVVVDVVAASTAVLYVLADFVFVSAGLCWGFRRGVMVSASL